MKKTDNKDINDAREVEEINEGKPKKTCRVLFTFSFLIE